MTPRRILFAIAIIAGGGLVLLIYLSTRREPTYAGKTLGQWVQQLDSRDFYEQRAAVIALRQLGSEPLPQLRSQ